MPWFKRFPNPITLADGRKLLTLQDAVDYITALPKVESDAADWKLASEALALAAERRGYERLARAAMMRALQPPLAPEPPPEPRRLRIVR
jgi:hypothetical protein